MFGALNRFIARLDSDPPQQSSTTSQSDNSFGFQVLRNTNAELTLEPWFDFIIGINGRLIDNPDPQLFAREVSNCAGHSLSLEIWSAKGQRTHNLVLALPPAPQSLGLTLQLAPLEATQNIWHILSIPSSLSPAHLAGLLPYSDYILGTPSGTLRGESALGELVEDHLNRSLVLWVYNSEFDVVREVELIPRRGWGGEGALGAVLGFGALHRLPVGLGEEVQAPGEKMFDAEPRSSTEKSYATDSARLFSSSNGGGQMLQPAQRSPPFVSPNVDSHPSMMIPKASSGAITTHGSAPSHGKKSRQRAAASPSKAFDDMFEEGAKKSQEQDYVPRRKASPLPPPPKMSGSGVPSTTSRPQSSRPDPIPVPPRSPELGEPGHAEPT